MWERSVPTYVPTKGGRDAQHLLPYNSVKIPPALKSWAKTQSRIEVNEPHVVFLSRPLQVAVKVIDKRKAKKDSYVTKNLRREGHIQQMIRHPNITQLLDILETENSYYLVMELCPGGNLMNRIYDKKRLDERETQKYIRQLVLAVEHLHRAGVVHR